ncbi:aldo/keto reductase [Enterovibrio sp. ZSDZ42]|uniref:Aldo/keto reductase n=1 Tax=Enterovibrio gelatinilyticus TaxID=2899819 RepID=A0ABT5QZQ0_9GAMM|nr:aldo/keto reductase [Enterovibrio sp. ZSDZ42]MDD1793464.1 aldo/keto reductase [Enterovibrio sp. ZSDZ42]
MNVNINDRLIAGFWRTSLWGKSSKELNYFINQLIECGITTFDHAYVYRSEAAFGEAMAHSASLREQAKIITKCGIRGVGPGSLDAKNTSHYDSDKLTIIKSVDNSLKDLKTDYVDTLLLHRPDYLMNVQEVNEAFNELKRSGKVRDFGVSNFNVTQFNLLQSALDVKLCTNQIEFSPFNTEALDNGLFDQCYKNQVSPMIWSCLGGGKLFDESHPVTSRLTKVLNEIAEEIGAVSISQVVYAWVFKMPCQPRIITGSSKIENISPLVDSIHLTLSKEQWYQIWAAAVGHDVA